MKKDYLLLILFIALKFLLQFNAVHPVYELHRDEFLHIDQGKHLSWGYLSVPPFTSWISALILALGNSEFWVRFFPALFGALTILVVWKTVEVLKGGTFAKILAATALLFSVLLRINLLYQPNSADILFWTLCFYAFVKYFVRKENKWLYFAAVSFGLGFLNKYNIVFLAAGLLPAILLTSQRKIIANKHTYWAMLLSIIIISPNLVWQYQHHFPVIDHMNKLSATQLENVSRSEFLLQQLLFFIGAIYVLLAGLISFFTFHPFKKYRFFFHAFILTLAIYFVFQAKGYYTLGLYPVYFSFGAVYLEYLLRHGWRKFLRPVAVIIPVLLFIPFALVVFPLKPPSAIAANNEMYKKLGLLTWEDGKTHELPQDFADMIGWKELARKVDSAYSSIGDPSHTLVLTDNYGQAGAINFYSKKNFEAVSFNADYINWFPLQRPIRHVILVKDAPDEDPGRTKERPYFQNVEKAARIEQPYAREKGTTIYILRQSRSNINQRLKEEMDERRGFSKGLPK